MDDRSRSLATFIDEWVGLDGACAGLAPERCERFFDGADASKIVNDMLLELGGTNR